MGNDNTDKKIKSALVGTLVGAGAILFLGNQISNNHPKLLEQEVQVGEPNNDVGFGVFNPNQVPNEASNSVPKTADYNVDDFLKDSDEVLLARMLFGEARGCSTEEKIAVAYSAINRINDGIKWNGETLSEVILKHRQYSCFNENNVNRKKLRNPQEYDSRAFNECLKIAKSVLDGKYSNLNKGQTHFFNPNDVYPYWADEFERIGKIENSEHDFYIED